MPRFVMLWTDVAMWLLIAAVVGYVLYVLRQPTLRASWRKVFMDKAALASSIVLVLCLVLTLLDSLHFRPLLPPAPGAAANAAPAYDARTRSVLDTLLWRLVQSREATYSRPLAYVGFTKESVTVNGQVTRVAPRLKFGGAHLKDPESEWAGDVALRLLGGLAGGAVLAAAAAGLLLWLLA
ncbi:MAG: ABC transporter permease, partial [Rubrivivax sp.]|nr:ABC transporter permease [Rubrivivax sp.]